MRRSDESASGQEMLLKMHRFLIAALASVVVGSLAFVSGCGGEEDKSVEPSAAAKNADQANQDAMRKTMESKGKSKSAKH